MDLEALNQLKQHAQMGDAKAAFDLGVYLQRMHEYSPRDPDQSLHWLMTAAKLGHAPAMLAISKLPPGQIEKSGKSRQEWVRSAAHLGDREATRILTFEPLVPGCDETTLRKALDQISVLVTEGDIRAAYNIADMYRVGNVVQRDRREMLYWFRRAAESEDNFARYMLAIHLFKDASEGRERDEAISILRTVDIDDHRVSHILEFANKHGIGITRSYDAAMQQIHKQIEQGEIETTFELAVFELNVEDNRPYATTLLEKNIAKGHVPSLLMLGGLWRMSSVPDYIWPLVEKEANSGDVNAAYLMADKNELHPDNRKAYEQWLEKAASGGHPQAIYDKGRLYYWGRGDSRNLSTATQLFEKAAKLGVKSAFYWLGRIQEEQGDLAGALESYVAAAGDYDTDIARANLLARPSTSITDFNSALRIYRNFMGNSEAMLGIGKLYEYGHGVKFDPGEASNWYVEIVNSIFDTAMMRASDQEAAFRLGQLFEEGKGRTKSAEIAAYCYMLSGNEQAFDRLSAMFESGIGVEKDLLAAYLCAAYHGGGMGNPLSDNALRLSKVLTPQELEDAAKKLSYWQTRLQDLGQDSLEAIL
jgi:TPR repeat protein